MSETQATAPLARLRDLANKADRRRRELINRLETRLRKFDLPGLRRKYDVGRVMFLPRTLDCRGEFTFEILLFIPFVHWLSAAGLLKGRTIRTYKGMRSFYEGLDFAAYKEKSDPRDWIRPRDQPGYIPVRFEHEYPATEISPFHVFPNMRARFGPQTPSAGVIAALGDRPVLIIHNKYAREWNGPPVNFISTDTLDHLFSTLKAAFTIVYIRHGIRAVKGGYVADHSDLLTLDDPPVLARHPDVLLFDDLFDLHVSEGGDNDVNRFKNMLCARSHNYISVQGGGAHHLATFAGSLMVLLHRRGLEDQLAYGDNGFYSFMANPAPVRLCCGDEDELKAAAQVFLHARLCGDRVHVGAEGLALVEQFSPAVFMAARKGAE